jgi:hypothetical protein
MNENNLPAINSHNSWSRLEEVWLGDVYPAAWYDHLEPEVRDVFYKLTEITKQDLDCIEKTLTSMGIQVRRPHYDHIDNYVDQHTGQLHKPQITPRDHFVVVGNDLLGHDLERMIGRPWRHIIEEYIKDDRCSYTEPWYHCINGANVVRAGRDIIVDQDVFDFEYNNQWPQYRVHLVKNGGHLDGCFAVLRPGLLLASRYFLDYAQTFPGWEVIMLYTPTYFHKQPAKTPRHPKFNGKFWDTTVGSNRSFNEHVIKHALDWVGDYTETYFELNCLVIDEQNVVMLAENESLANKLQSLGINVHWVPFRTRSFWDGAMHCLTLDIRRQSTIVDYFPEREQR